MPSYFVDAWYFIALANRLDAHHAAAQRLKRAFDRVPFVSHDSVLGEVLAYFARYGWQNRTRAASMVRDALVRCEIVTPDRSLFLSALDLYERRPDKEYSLVDRMSMTLMRQRGVTTILTNDHHFRQEGFTVLSDAP